MQNNQYRDIGKLINKYSYLSPDSNLRMQYLFNESKTSDGNMIQRKIELINKIYYLTEHYDKLIEDVIINNDIVEIENNVSEMTRWFNKINGDNNVK